MKIKLCAGLLLTVGVMVSGCTDRPKREVFPGPQGRTTDVQAAENRQAMLGGFDSLQATAGTGGAEGVAEIKISGTILLEAGAVSQGARKLFISVRPVAGGPPIAALRLDVPTKFPIEFEITDRDRISMGGSAGAGASLLITARLDRDGDPLSREPGELMASLETGFQSSGVKLVLRPN